MRCIICGKDFERKSNRQKCCGKRCSKINLKRTMNKWVDENRARKLEINTKWRLNNPERKKKSDEDYRKNNKKKIAKTVKQYYLENKEKIDDYKNKWYKEQIK